MDSEWQCRSGPWAPFGRGQMPSTWRVTRSVCCTARKPARAHAARRLSVATASGRQCPASSDRDLRLVHVHGARFIGARQPQPGPLAVPPWQTRRSEPARDPAAEAAQGPEAAQPPQLSAPGMMWPAGRGRLGPESGGAWSAACQRPLSAALRQPEHGRALAPARRTLRLGVASSFNAHMAPSTEHATASGTAVAATA
jgi:hypothetical protein